MEAFAPEIENALEHPVDFKSALQERLARRGELVDYAVVDEQGPPHDRTFTVSATIKDVEIGSGTGRSKKDAEQAAAQAALGIDLSAGYDTFERARTLGGTLTSVYLKSITVKGFKSFPDRTKLEFGPGVSVVVGPNGSGKSNVTDAVLWALGSSRRLPSAASRCRT